jgi:transcriptional regulator with XRE-family HTH domain
MGSPAKDRKPRKAKDGPAVKNKRSDQPVGEYLRELIAADADGRTFADIARQAGMSRSGLNIILSGHARKPTLEMICKILKAIDDGVECYGCKGTGKCPHCDGRGKF